MFKLIARLFVFATDGLTFDNAKKNLRYYQVIDETYNLLKVDVKTVSAMLGYYDAGFTLRTYTHATLQMQIQAAEKIGNFMTRIT